MSAEERIEYAAIQVMQALIQGENLAMDTLGRVEEDRPDQDDIDWAYNLANASWLMAEIFVEAGDTRKAIRKQNEELQKQKGSSK